MQVLVLYYSKTGNTEKLAHEIETGVQEVKDIDCLVKSVGEVSEEDFLSSEGIIAGSPVYFGTMAAELKKVFDDFIGIRKKMEDKIGAAFATSNHHTGGKETTLFSIIQAMMIYGMIIVGDPLNATGHYGIADSKNRDPQTAENAAKLGKRVAEVVKKMYA